ncbi:MAG: helix-turn-helix transcriptional regulator [Chitinophagaceae bacterium]|nr:helix-turn-helix transcriptional regulator [Chitinophagaceae bacterium]
MEMEAGLYTGCPIQFTLQFLSGRWRIGVLWNLRNCARRFSELKVLLPGISDKALAEELGFFAGKGIITKSSFPGFPPRTEYILSDTGKTLLPVIERILAWGYENLQNEKMHTDMLKTPLAVIEELATTLNDRH